MCMSSLASFNCCPVCDALVDSIIWQEYDRYCGKCSNFVLLSIFVTEVMT